MIARLIAFYLPQFHPIPENDRWWGKGFTEWTNVARARPLFRGHYQPHLPADLGFYDLRLHDVRLAQAQLAAAHGIEGFCYWHYWFNGQRLLERPFNAVLASGKPKLPFCLAWANETWSRRWLGDERDILMKQLYSPGDDLDHARWLTTAFSDTRYIRVANRPLFLVYRPRDLPDSNRTIDVLRTECVRQGLPEPYLLGIDAHCPGVDCRTLGFDGTLVFAPQLGALPGFNSDHASFAKFRRNVARGVVSWRLKIYDYQEARALMMARTRDFPFHPCVLVGWDNTPRRGPNGIVIVNSTPERFAAALQDVLRSVATKPPEDRLVFVNAWNEWAEGNHLEPDRRYGLAYLNAITAVTSAHQTKQLTIDPA
jgi:lipopolysaccharide biosynthesis protein